MSITSLLNVSKLGVFSSQGALKVVSHNISNVNTPGYSKQKVVLSTNATNSQRIDSRGGSSGGDGVVIAEVQRSNDQLVENRMMIGDQEVGRLEARNRFMNLIEEVFNELDDDGLSDRMESFFTAADSSADNPTNPVVRTEMLAQADSMTRFVNNMYSSLSELAMPVDQEIDVQLQDMNGKLKALGKINLAIMRQANGPDNALDLKDTRQTMLHDLAEQIDITVLPTSDGEGVRVLTKSGQPLVDGTHVADFSRREVNPEHGYQGIQISNRDFDFTDSIQGGALKGLVEVRDEMLGGDSGFLTRLEGLVDEIRYQVNKSTSQSIPEAMSSSQTGVFTLGSDTTTGTLDSLTTGAGTPVTSSAVAGVSVGTINTSQEHYPGAGTKIVMSYDAANAQYTITEDGKTAAYSPQSEPTSYPGTVALRWADVTIPTQPTTDGDNIAFTVPMFDAPPDLDKVVAGELKIAYGSDVDNLDMFTIDIDPATMTIQGVVDAINNNAPANSVSAAINSNNQFVLSENVSGTGVYGVTSDASGIMAALGVGALIGGTGAQDMKINSDMKTDNAKLPTGKAKVQIDLDTFISGVSVNGITSTDSSYPDKGTAIVVTYDAANSQYTVTEDGTAAANSPVAEPGTYPGTIDLGWMKLKMTSAPTDGQTINFSSAKPEFDNGDNAGVIEVGSLRSTRVTIAGDTASFAAHYATMVGNLGSEISMNEQDLEATQATQSYLLQVRESAAGVSLEEELTDLIRYQRSFQAASKMIGVADELMETIISII